MPTTLPRRTLRMPAPLTSSTDARLRSRMGGDGWKGYLTADEVKAMMQAEGYSDVHTFMLALLPYATGLAKPPVSNYKVGAVSLGTSGGVYFGANLEFVGEALSFTVHAEQAAVTSAWVNGETGVLALAISAAPCGYCRQFLYELVTAAQLVIVLPGQGASPATTRPLTDYLPDPFGPKDLGVDGGLMQPTDNGLALDAGTDDPVVLAALASANASYAPYTKGYAGVALQTAEGRVFAAAYCDNAAFNPAMSPLEAALSWLNVCGGAFADVRRAVLVQAGPTLASQVDATRVILSAVAPSVTLEVEGAHVA